MPTLTLQLQKNAIQAGEPLLSTLLLRNADGQPVKVNARLAINSPSAPAEFREVALTVSDVFGRQLDFQPKVNIGFTGDANFQVLAPGEAADVRYNLALYYDLSQPGQYKVYATYQAQLAPEVPSAAGMWTGTVKSPVVQFTVRA